MKISNFRDLTRAGEGLRDMYIAKVDVTTRDWLFRKKTSVKCVGRHIGGYWFWVDTGGFTPGNEVEYLSKAYEAQELVDKSMKGL